MEIKMDKNTLRLFFWERDFMLFFSEVSLRNALYLSDSSPLLPVWSLEMWHGVMLPALGEGRKKGKPQINWDSLGKSVCIPLLVSGYFIHFCTPAGDHEPCSESSACFLLQPFQMTSSCPEPLSPNCKPQASFGPVCSSCLSLIYTKEDSKNILWN